jgi:hypothetical protein
VPCRLAEQVHGAQRGRETGFFDGAENFRELDSQRLVHEEGLHPRPTSTRPAEAEHLASIVRLVRRICLLREQGDQAGARRLQTGDLADAVKDVRLESGPASLSEEKLCALFVSESEHVAEAMVLAELLAPQLARLLPAADPSRTPLFASPPAAEPATRAIPGEAPAISDLLDAMLAAERPGRRPGPVRPRE